MVIPDAAKQAESKLVKQLQELREITGKRSEAERKHESRQRERNFCPPPVADPARRAECEADDARWLRTYLPYVFSFPFTAAQQYYVDTIGECMEYGRRKCIAAPRGDGKALAIDTPLPTPNGWVTMGDVQVGDELFDDRGQPCKVTFATDVQVGRDCFRVRFSDEEEIIADSEHLWVVRDRWAHDMKALRVLSTADMVGRVDLSPKKTERRYAIPLTKPLELPKAELPIAPYTFGIWLGDGTASGNTLTVADDELEILEHIQAAGVTVVARTKYARRESKCRTYLIGGTHAWGDRPATGRRNQSMMYTLRSMGVLNNKHIPQPYLRASVAQRRALLQGLMDSDGYASGRKATQCEFVTNRPTLRDGVAELLSSLGIKFTCRQRFVTLDGKLCGPYFRMFFTAYKDNAVFRIAKKASRLTNRPTSHHLSTSRQIVAIDPVPSVPVRCIQVDSPSHLYLAGRGMVPTHNTSIFRYLALKYALERRVRFFLLLSATDGKAGYQLAAIKDKLAGCRIDYRQNTMVPLTTLAEDYPLECGIASYVAPSPARAKNATVHNLPLITNWPGETLILPQFAEIGDVPDQLVKDYGLRRSDPLSAIIMAVGWKSNQIQGCNVLDVRPDFVGMDDLDNRDSLASEIGTVAEKIGVQIETNISGLAAVSKRLGMTMLCTVPSRESVAYRYSDPAVKPAWSGIRVRRIKTWPVNTGLRDQYIDLRQRGQKTMGDDRKPVDPDAREACRFYLANQEAIEEGAELSNPNDFQGHPAADGTPAEVSGLQHCYNFIADNSLAAFETEYQNNPPVEDEDDRIELTTYHIRARARSDYERYVCPPDTVLVTRGADLSNRGIYWVTVAWNAEAAGAIVDFNYERFVGMEDVPISACERLVYSGLQEWWEEQADQPCEIHNTKDTWTPDLTFIDAGWQDPAWGTQPVYLLAVDQRFRGVLPCRGAGNWRRRRPTKGKVWPYDEVNLVLADEERLRAPDGRIVVKPAVLWAELHTDALKLRCHHGLLQPFGTPGSLGLYTPPLDGSGREKWSRHQDFAAHILAEEWQKQPNGIYQWVAAGQRPGGRRRLVCRNHWLDSLAYAIGARNIWGVSTIPIAPPKLPPVPKPPKPVSMERPYLASERV